MCVCVCASDQLCLFVPVTCLAAFLIHIIQLSFGSFLLRISSLLFTHAKPVHQASFMQHFTLTQASQTNISPQAPLQGGASPQCSGGPPEGWTGAGKHLSYSDSESEEQGPRLVGLQHGVNASTKAIVDR